MFGLEKIAGTDMNMTRQEELGMIALIESILPSFRKFITPVKEKLEEFLGDDSKMVVLRRLKRKDGYQTYVIVIDNDAEYEISSTKDKKGEVTKKMSFGGEEKDGKKKINIFSVEEFIEQIADDNAFKAMIKDYKNSVENKEQE